MSTAQEKSLQRWEAPRAPRERASEPHALRCTGFGLLVVLCLAGCESRGSTANIAGGDPKRGAELIREVGCASCHTIPGIRGANGLVGPPLMFFSRRTYVAGRLPNTPANLVGWIRDPQAIDPATAMPTIGLDEQQARDIAAYLYTLR